MNLPARFIRGQALTADRLNDLIEAIRRARPLPGAGVSTRESPDGTFISAAAQTQTAPAVASTPFSHRWKVTVTTVTDDNGSATHTLHITPGSLWRNDGAGVTDLNVIPDGDTVTTDSDGNWLVENATTGSLYVVDNSANQDASSSTGTAANPYPLVYGDPASETRPILLRIADLTLTTSATQEAILTQRQVGDALYSPGGSAGDYPGPWERDGDTWKRFLGHYAPDASGAYAFVKTLDANGKPIAVETAPSADALYKTADGNAIATAPMPVFADTTTPWLQRRTATFQDELVYSPPASETGTGHVAAATVTVTYFADVAAQKGAGQDLFMVQVEEANEAAHYTTDA